MIRRREISIVLFGCAAAGACLAAAAPPANIVFIMADDLGYGDLGCYGQETIETPRLDAMAREGMRFTQHYAGNTVCAPARNAGCVVTSSTRSEPI